MGKIQANPYGYKPEEGQEEEGAEERPAFETEEGEEGETPEVQTEGEEVVVPGEGEEQESEGGKKEEKEEPETPATPATPATATPATPAPEEEQEEEKDEDEEDLSKLVFWNGYRDDKGVWHGEAPKDWNDFARTIIGYMSPKNYAPKILQVIRGMTTAERKEMEKIDQGFDAEYDELATKGLVPKRDTKEGQEINAKISVIGGTYGMTSMKSAYDLAKKIPVDQGGLLDYKSTTTTKTNPSKQVSKLIGSSSQTQGAGKPKAKMSYAKLHGARSVDELIDEE